MRERQTAWLMSIGAAALFIAGCFNLLFPGAAWIFPSRSQASIGADDPVDADDRCADTTELPMAMTASRQTQQRRTLVASAAGADATGIQTAPARGDLAPARSGADAD